MVTAGVVVVVVVGLEGGRGGGGGGGHEVSGEGACVHGMLLGGAVKEGVRATPC